MNSHLVISVPEVRQAAGGSVYAYIFVASTKIISDVWSHVDINELARVATNSLA